MQSQDRALHYTASRGKQESWAIAKMTTRCALYMNALKIFALPTTTFPEIFNGLYLD